MSGSGSRWRSSARARAPTGGGCAGYGNGRSRSSASTGTPCIRGSNGSGRGSCGRPPRRNPENRSGTGPVEKRLADSTNRHLPAERAEPVLELGRVPIHLHDVERSSVAEGSWRGGHVADEVDVVV